MSNPSHKVIETKQNKKSWLEIGLGWLAVILWMACIYKFSSQSLSEQDVTPWIQHHVSEKFVTDYLSGVNFTYSGHEISIAQMGAYEFVQFFIRKAAHLTEFAILGVLFFWIVSPLYKLNRLNSFLLSFLCCFSYASLDEYHQKFSFARTPSLSDVVLDTVGGMVAILCLWGLINMKNNVKNKRITQNKKI